MHYIGFDIHEKIISFCEQQEKSAARFFKSNGADGAPECGPNGTYNETEHKVRKHCYNRKRLCQEGIGPGGVDVSFSRTRYSAPVKCLDALPVKIRQITWKAQMRLYETFRRLCGKAKGGRPGKPSDNIRGALSHISARILHKKLQTDACVETWPRYPERQPFPT